MQVLKFKQILNPTLQSIPKCNPKLLNQNDIILNTTHFAEV